MCYWGKDRHIDQCKKIESPEIDSHIVIWFWLSCQDNLVKKSLFNKWAIGHPYVKNEFQSMKN